MCDPFGINGSKQNLEAAGRGALAPGVIGAALLTVALWSSAFPAIAVALKGLLPGHLALLRFGTACVVLWLLVALDGARSGRWPRVERRDWGLMFLGGAVGTTAYHALLNWGQRDVAPGPAAFLIATAPLWGLLLAPLVGERVGRGVWGGVGVALAGVLLISWGQARARGEGFGAILNPSALLILGAAFSGGASGIIYRRLLSRGMRELHLTAVTTLIGTALLLPFAPGLGEAVRAAPRAAIGCALYLGIFPTAIAYLAWSYALKRAGVTRVVPFVYLVPVGASLGAWAVLRQVPSVTTLTGGAIVLAGVVAAQRAARRV